MKNFKTAFPYPPSSIPNLAGKIAIITGANSGLGKENAIHFAAKGCKVYMLSRSVAKMESAIQEIKSKTPEAQVEAIQCDFTDMDSVVKATKAFKAKETRLDILMLK